MSDKKKKQAESWAHLRNAAPTPKGPEKPWPSEDEQSAEQLVEFLKDSNNKKVLKDFIIETYKNFESEKITEFKARMENERESDNERLAPFHQSGNIAPIMANDLNMTDTERAFSRGLRSTKRNLDRAVEDRVEEINRLLAGIGGFNSQIKSCFARSTVVFLEQDDPHRSFRERLTFSIHLPHYELKHNWKEAVAPAAPKINNHKPMGSMGGARKTQATKKTDGRTQVQVTWDDAINALAAIIETSGLKPKYCKNDRNYGRFVMKQDLRHNSALPDEYFSLTLDYNTEEKIKEMAESYNSYLANYNRKIGKLKKKHSRYAPDAKTGGALAARQSYYQALAERDLFVATTPDPNQLDEGLLFLIEVSTLKDYHIVKDKMQSIMTKFILHLSAIAAQEAEIDPDLEYELWKTGQKTEKKGSNGMISEDELESVQEYVVSADALKPKAKKGGGGSQAA